MNMETWLLFFVAYLIVTLAPGPNVLLVVKNAVKYGYKAASTTILLNLMCQGLIIVSVAFGAGTLLEKSPVLFLGLKVIGGTYLIYLGVTGLFKKSKASDIIVDKTKVLAVPSYRKLCKDAFLVSASNPKTVIFLSAFLPQFLSTETSIGGQFFIMFLTICVIVASVHLSYSCMAKNIQKKWSGSKIKAKFSKITSCAFIAFGFGVLSSNRVGQS